MKPKPTDAVNEENTEVRQKTKATIEQFAKDFNIDYESYKYNEKTLVVTFTCVDTSPSEISYYSWSVPAFVISTYQHKLAQEANKTRLDTISDMIIECYNHDNPMDIAKELIEERRRLEDANSVIQNKLEGLQDE
jgi:hypothetical protein